MASHALDSILATTQSSSKAWRKTKENNSVENRFFQQLNRARSEAQNSVSIISSGLNPKLVPYNAILKLNIGGSSFQIDHQTIKKTKLNTFLHRFIQFPHSVRVNMCDGYIEDTGQYFFERSAVLFKPIYMYYITGECGKPNFPCVALFNEELEFWGLTEQFTPKCCNTHDPLMLKKKENANIPDPFKTVLFGKCRKAVWDLIEDPHSSVYARLLSAILLAAVLLCTLVLLLGSIPYFQVPEYHKDENETHNETLPHLVLIEIETGCIVLFTVEYFVKMLVAANRLQAFLKPLTLVDFVAIIPFIIEQILDEIGIHPEKIKDVEFALLTMRVLSIMRVVRLLKLGRHCSGLRMFALTLRRSVAQLGLCLMILAIATMFFSSALYYIERDEINTKFQSIPAACWWCLVTMTTVGYGDMYPSTIFGKIVASFAIGSGVLVIALPITVVVENYVQLREELLKFSNN